MGDGHWQTPHSALWSGDKPVNSVIKTLSASFVTQTLLSFPAMSSAGHSAGTSFRVAPKGLAVGSRSPKRRQEAECVVSLNSSQVTFGLVAKQSTFSFV